MKTFIKNHKKIFSAAIVLTVLISSVIVFASQKLKKADASGVYNFTNSLGESCSLLAGNSSNNLLAFSTNSSTNIKKTIKYNSDTDELSIKSEYINGNAYKNKGTETFDIGYINTKISSTSSASICYIPNNKYCFSYKFNAYGDGYSRITYDANYKIPTNTGSFLFYTASINTFNRNIKALTNSSKGAIKLTLIANSLDMNNTSDIEYLASFIADINESDISSAAKVTQNFYTIENRFNLAIKNSECTKQ